MASLVRRLTAAVLLAGFAMFSANADDKKKAAEVPDMHDIMGKNKGKNSLANQIAAAAKAEKWEDCQKLATQIKELGVALGKNEPAKGDKDSWAKFAKKYAEDTAGIAEAAEKKDAASVKTKTDAFSGKENCSGCHKVHK